MQPPGLRAALWTLGPELSTVCRSEKWNIGWSLTGDLESCLPAGDRANTVLCATPIDAGVGHPATLLRSKEEETAVWEKDSMRARIFASRPYLSFDDMSILHDNLFCSGALLYPASLLSGCWDRVQMATTYMIITDIQISTKRSWGGLLTNFVQLTKVAISFPSIDSLHHSTRGDGSPETFKVKLMMITKIRCNFLAPFYNVIKTFDCENFPGKAIVMGSNPDL